MWIADQWKDYEVLDTSEGEKLERWGSYLLIRPDPQVIWDTEKKDPGWRKFNARYHRSHSGGGDWEFRDLPEQWTIGYRDLTFHLKPFSFKHTGLFPEQAVNWDWCAEQIRSEIKRREQAGDTDPGTGKVRPVKVLNLFAYTGGATLSAAAAGAAVTHVDASKGMVGWAKENAASSGLSDRPVRWLVDDCTKFVEREIRRGHHYDGIIMDPPSYGRGPKGEIWKMEDNIYPFIRLCTEIFSEKPLFFLINSYTTGLAPSVLTYMLETALADWHGHAVSSEIGLPVRDTGLVLPCGSTGRWTPSGAGD
ncbi:MAG: class I SAM-dependent methyltransferase [Eubacteriales bacterium]|jgi:23S rRNA (cytosine1962-C5)-methyltransferase